MQQAYDRQARVEYERALRIGKKEYSASIARGERGNLLVLDEIAEQNRVMAYVKRPSMEIPLSRVVGTYTSGRSYSFSPNFMPLHPESSEFASKWITLCAAHMGEGLRDAIQVYEYMWNYYVVEGNKRVSVLKYFEALTVRAEITRMIPQVDAGDPDTVLYYAFLQYEKNGLFKGLRLSSEEKYRQLSRLEEDYIASGGERDVASCNSIYIQFVAACEQAGIKQPVGDVMLEYIRLYGVPAGTVLSEITARVTAMQPQLEQVAATDKEPTLLLETKEEAPVGLIERLFSPRRTATIAFAYEKGRTDDNWIGAHEKGRQVMQQEMGDRVETIVVDGLTPENGYEELTKHTKNADLVLITTTRLVTPALRFALENPGVMTLVYSRVRQDARLGTYYGRYYESIFLCGVAAGFATRSGKVAYITPQTEKRFTPDINAFGLGVKTVSPETRVMLIQKGVVPHNPETCAVGMREAAQRGADVVLSPLYPGLILPGMPKDAFSAVVRLEEDGTPGQYIASPAWDWGRYYTEIAKSYLNHSLDMLQMVEKSDANLAGLWWGLGTGVLKFRMADFVHPIAANLVRYLRSSIALGRFNPFHGPLFDQENVLRIPEHSDPKPYDILNMEWIADFIRVID